MPKMHLTHSEEEDEAQLEDFPILLTPVMMDYGYNVKYVSITTTYFTAVSTGFVNST